MFTDFLYFINNALICGASGCSVMQYNNCGTCYGATWTSPLESLEHVTVALAGVMGRNVLLYVWLASCSFVSGYDVSERCLVVLFFFFLKINQGFRTLAPLDTHSIAKTHFRFPHHNIHGFFLYFEIIILSFPITPCIQPFSSTP